MFYWTPLAHEDKEAYDALWRTAEEKSAASGADINRTHWTPPKTEP